MTIVNHETSGEDRTVRPFSRLAMPWRMSLGVFRRSRLEVQFIIVASLVVVGLMFALGLWTTRSIERAILQGAGTVEAGYLQAFVGPLISQSDIQKRQVDPALGHKLDQLLKTGPLGEHVKEVKIWNPDGSLFYSASGRTVGDALNVSDLKRAMAGEIRVSRAVTTEPKASGPEAGDEYIEVYVPLVQDAAGNTVLVAEFYERPNYLLNEISSAWRAVLMIVLLVSVPMLAMLFLIVRKGSLLIDRQHAALSESLRHALKLSSQNKRLRSLAEFEKLESGRLNEQILNQIGSELHDGPIQILTLIKLRMSDMAEQPAYSGDDVTVPRATLVKLLQFVTQLLDDTRNISLGLVLPELDSLSLSGTISLAVKRHTDLTGQEVDLSGTIAQELTSVHLGTCVYRFVQEALMNAHRHAPASAVKLRYHTRRNRFVVVVADEGAAPTYSKGNSSSVRLGTLMQRRRIRAFGGRMRIIHRRYGTAVLAILPLEQTITTRDPGSSGAHAEVMSQAARPSGLQAHR